jgi:hypothetical protein
VNFIDGVFYRVPLTGGLVSLGTTNSCQEASQALNTAEQILIIQLLAIQIIVKRVMLTGMLFLTLLRPAAIPLVIYKLL